YRCRRLGAGDILALGLRQQPIGLTGFFSEPSGERFCPVPGDPDDGALAAAPTVVLRRLALAAAVGNAGVPFIEGHGKATDRERVDECDVVQRGFALAM